MKPAGLTSDDAIECMYFFSQNQSVAESSADSRKTSRAPPPTMVAGPGKVNIVL